MSRPRLGRKAAVLAAGLVSLAIATSAWAAQYPPGPMGCCPDTLTIINVQNPLANPNPQTGDVVLGVGGIITAFAQTFPPFGFYMQMQNGLPYSGVPVYTGLVDHGPGTPDNLQPGDSVVVYGKIKSYQEAIAIGSLGGFNDVITDLESSQSNLDVTVRVVSHGTPLPAFHVGTAAELSYAVPNPTARPWDGMLVRVNGPLRVVKVLNETELNTVLLGFESPTHPAGFLAVEAGCSDPNCDTLMVDCRTLTNIDPPPVGTLLGFVQGCLDRRQDNQVIQLRGSDDLVVGSPPVALDAFPIYDNDLPGPDRVDSVMVVFDRAVDKTTAENVANYSLAPPGIIDGAHRLDAPDDNRVVLRIRDGLDDGATMALTVMNVASLVDGTVMAGPQTFHFLNGVLELEKVQAPDPAFLAADPCQDRSRYAGAGSNPGLRASFVGTVTGAFGSDYTLQGMPPLRSGLWVHSPAFALIPGHQVVLAGAIAEISGETWGTGIVYARDFGPAPEPAPMIQSVNVLLDDTCDATQVFLNGQDLDAMRVTLDHVQIVATEPAGSSFYVALPGTLGQIVTARLHATKASLADAIVQIQVVSPGGSFVPVAGRIVTVTGVLGQASGAFAVFLRNGSDIIDFGPNPTFSPPLNVSKSATASRDPDIVLGTGGQLFMAWDRVFNESVHSLSLDDALNWSVALKILHQGVQPAVAVTPSDKFCVLSGSTDSLFYKQSTDGGFQMDAIVTTVDHFPTRYPALTVGGGEHLHAAWERTGTGVFYARSLTGGADFSTPMAIATNSLSSETNSMARICASKGDTVSVFWQYHLTNDPDVNKVLYRRSVDGGVTFSPARLVRDESNPLTSVVKLAILGDAQIGPNGIIYVMGIQQGGPNDSVAFLRSTNGGLTFALVGHPTAPALTGLCPKSFAVGPGGAIHALIGICGTALYYTASTDGGVTWGPAVNVTSSISEQVGEPRGAKIILGPNGKPVIVWFAPVGGSTEIHSTRLLN
jgi:hypothetical protein